MKRLILSAAAAATAISMAAPANAAIVQFTATTKGCFGTASCTPITGDNTTPGSVHDDFLKYISGSVNNASDINGTLYVGGGSDNFGRFSLGTTPDSNYAGDIFRLEILFTQPGAANTIIDAVVLGAVSLAGDGSLRIDWGNNGQANTPIYLTASNGQEFSLLLDDTSVTAGNENAWVTGTLQAVPEPGAWAMMLLGFAGIGMVMRRTNRRSNSVLAQIA